MRRMLSIGIAWIAEIGVLWPGGASAQNVTPTFSELSSKLRSGETVYVTDDSGQTVRGRLLAIAIVPLIGRRSAGLAVRVRM